MEITINIDGLNRVHLDGDAKGSCHAIDPDFGLLKGLEAENTAPRQPGAAWGTMKLVAMVSNPCLTYSKR